MFIRVYILIFKKNKKTTRQKAKETKKENRISMEKPMGCDVTVLKFALCTFDLLDQVVNFSRLFI